MRSDSDLHRDWLGLLDTDGPFLSVPALKKAWPTGMPVPDRAALDALRDAKPAFEKAWDVWDMAEKATADQAAAALAEYQQARDAWVDVVLRTVLGWKNFYLTPASVDREGPRARLLGHRQPDRRAHPRRHDRSPRPRHRPGRVAASPAR